MARGRGASGSSPPWPGSRGRPSWPSAWLDGPCADEPVSQPGPAVRLLVSAGLELPVTDLDDALPRRCATSEEAA